MPVDVTIIQAQDALICLTMRDPQKSHLESFWHESNMHIMFLIYMKMTYLVQSRQSLTTSLGSFCEQTLAVAQKYVDAS